MMWLRVTLAAATIVAGCSSLEGLSNNDGDAGTAEAGADTSTAVDAPAPADASPSDGDADAGAAKGCASITADYCIDFDDQVFPGAWTTVTMGAGTIGIDPMSSWSPSYSMLSATNGVTGENGGAITRPTGPLPDVVVMQARIRVEESDIKSSYDALALYFTQPNSADYFLDIEISATLDLHIQQLEYYPDGGLSSSTREALGVALRPGQWNLVKLTYTAATAKVVVEVTYEDGTFQTRALDIRGAPYRNAGEVQFGDERVQNGAVWRVRFDDVALDMTP